MLLLYTFNDTVFGRYFKDRSCVNYEGAPTQSSTC